MKINLPPKPQGYNECWDPPKNAESLAKKYWDLEKDRAKLEKEVEQLAKKIEKLQNKSNKLDCAISDIDGRQRKIQTNVWQAKNTHNLLWRL